MQNPAIPCDIDAEIAVMGSILMDENIIYQVSDILTPDDFFDSKNRLLYKVMLQLFRSGQKIDITTILSQLNKNNLLEQCGGIEYLSSIVDRTYTTSNIDTYIQLIENAALRRNTIFKLNELAQSGYDNKVSAFDYLELVEKNVFELSNRRRVEAFKPISIVSQNVMKQTEENATRTSEVIGLDTGFSSLNRYTQGFQGGQLIILAARPSMGKSAMAMNLAVNVATKNKDGHGSVAVFSLEMTAEQLFERMVAADSSIRLNLIKNGKIHKNDWIRFTTGCSRLGALNLFFDDSPGPTIGNIRAKCRKLKAEQGLDFVVIDYLGLIEADASMAHASTQAKITQMTRSLKLMARELDIPILVLCQLSRKVEDRDEKKPIMSDLRDSGSIEQDADIVMFLYREDYYNHSSERKGEADLIIAKNRSGSVHDGLPFIFTGEYQRFKEKKDEEN